MFSESRILNTQCTVICISCLLQKLGILNMSKELLLRWAEWLTNVKKILIFQVLNYGAGNLQKMEKWQEIENPIDPERLLTVTCSCIKAKSSSCQCSRLEKGSIIFCKCQWQCQYAPM